MAKDKMGRKTLENKLNIGIKHLLPYHEFIIRDFRLWSKGSAQIPGGHFLGRKNSTAATPSLILLPSQHTAKAYRKHASIIA